MSRSVKYNRQLKKKTPEKDQWRDHRRMWRLEGLFLKRKIMEKDLTKLHPIEIRKSPKDIYISLMERLSRAYY